MAAGAIAAVGLGFDGVQGCLIADPRLDAHVIEIEAVGPGEPGHEFTVRTVRFNPAKAGAVTGNATYASFFASLMHYHQRGNGVHFC